MRNHLKPLELHTLLALAQAPTHGYGLVGQIASDSEGTLRPLPGNLYVVLTRLENAGLIRQLETPDDRSRRRTYALTSSGQERLTAEARRMAALANAVAVRFGHASPEGDKG